LDEDNKTGPQMQALAETLQRWRALPTREAKEAQGFTIAARVAYRAVRTCELAGPRATEEALRTAEPSARDEVATLVTPGA
jgi:hypothetical protein